MFFFLISFMKSITYTLWSKQYHQLILYYRSIISQDFLHFETLTPPFIYLQIDVENSSHIEKVTALFASFIPKKTWTFH